MYAWLSSKFRATDAQVMELKVVLTAAICLAFVGDSQAEHSGPLHKFSCLHYCQTQNYGLPIKYCCRAAQVLLATAHSTATTHTHLRTSTVTTASTIKTLSTVVPVVATPVLANLLTKALGPAARGDVPAKQSITITPHLHPGMSTTFPPDLSDSDPLIYRGMCPPPRNYCPRANPEEPHLKLCKTDYDCFPTDKCCYDSCLYNNVCKTANIEKRRRRSSEIPYGSQDIGSAAATRVLLREDGEPVPTLLDEDNESVAVVEGDVLTIFRDFSHGFISRAPTPQATISLTSNTLVYVVEDDSGEVVVDASGNTLTLVSLGEGPTLLIHNAGVRVVRGRHALADAAFTGMVRKTLVPNLTVHLDIRYSRKTSSQQKYYHLKSFSNPVLTGRGRDVTLGEEAPLSVVNPDGVTFVIDISKTQEGSRGELFAIAVVDMDKLDTDVMIDDHGNLIVDTIGHPTTVQDIVGTMNHETNFEDGLQVIVDGLGYAVTLLNVNNNVIRLLDELRKPVSVVTGDYDQILSHYLDEATVHQTEDGFYMIMDGSGNVIEDYCGYPLVLMPYEERQKRSLQYFYTDDDEEDESSSFGEPSMEDSEDNDAEEMDSEFGSGEEDLESPCDANDKCESLWQEEEDDMEMIQGNEKPMTEAPDEGEATGSGLGEEDHHSGMEETTHNPEYRRRRHVQSMMPIPMMKRSVPPETPAGN